MKKLSIIILNWNTAELLKTCVAKVREHTTHPYELVLVDNGSSDGSVEMIESLRGEDTVTVFNDRNLGFSGGNNRGIAAASGDVICLLNSDAFVTPGWDRTLLACMEREDAGMAGPWTNSAKGSQRKKGYHRLIPAPLRGSAHVDYLSFFCVMIKREVFEAIGTLDEGFGLGTCEDDEFCRRAKAGGFKLVVDGRSWVWHEAHATMRANGIDEWELFRENRKVYGEKWGEDAGPGAGRVGKKGYFEQEREEMLALLPEMAVTRALDAGCGEGLFGARLKERTGAEVWGMELDKAAAGKAREVLDRVVEGDLAVELGELPPGHFDCIYFNDVLEHLYDPGAAVRAVRPALAEGGIVIASIPNVRFHKVLYKLVFKGSWNYKMRGVLDWTHLRFFTRSSMVEMFERAGYEVLSVRGLQRSKKLLPNLTALLTLGRFEDILYPQFALVTRPAAPAPASAAK